MQEVMDVEIEVIAGKDQEGEWPQLPGIAEPFMPEYIVRDLAA